MSGWRRARPTTQQFPRRPARVPIRISTIDAETDPDSGASFFRSTEATTANLSRGGAFVHSWEPLAAGRRVIVALDLPAGGELQLVGHVVWTRRRLEGRDRRSLETPGYGIEFDRISRADQAALQQILDTTGSTPGPLAPSLAIAGSSSNAPASNASPSPTASPASSGSSNVGTSGGGSSPASRSLASPPA